MKRKFFIIAAILLFTSVLSNSQIKYGPRLGISLTRINLSIPDVSNQVHWFYKPQLGGFVDIPFSDKFHFQPNLLLNFIGGGVSYEYSYSYYGKRNVTYVDVPLLFMFKPRLGDNLVFNIIFGGYAGYSLYGKNAITITSGNEKETVSTNIKWGNKAGTHQQRRGDYGVNLGFGFDFQRFQICLIGSYSLMDLNPQIGLDKSYAWYYSRERLYNMLITGSVAYFFGK